MGAVGYTLATSTRAILAKRSMGMDVGKNMSPANLYAVLTIMASVMLLPLAAILEGPRIKGVWAATVEYPEDGYVPVLVSSYILHPRGSVLCAPGTGLLRKNRFYGMKSCTWDATTNYRRSNTNLQT